METLIINVPGTKVKLVKEILKELGATFTSESHLSKPSDFLGVLSKNEAEAMLSEVKKSREDWEKNT